MIAKLKISVERKYVYPFFKILDADNSGGVEYSEFEKYIMQNPYWVFFTLKVSQEW